MYLTKVADSDPGSDAFFDPLNPGSGSEMEKNPDPEHISESLKQIFGFKILTFFEAVPDPGTGSRIF
jgi:hypothetical protein